MSLDGYLTQVKSKNEAFRGAVEASQAAKDRREEKDVPLSPTLFAAIRVGSDGKLPQLPFFTYRAIQSQNYVLGVSQQTTFGLNAKLSYQLDFTGFNSPVLPGAGGLPFRFYDARPVLEMSMPLWANGFGSSVRASRDLTDATHSASHFANRFAARTTLAQAEQAFWRLVIAREVVVIEQDALEQAKKIHEWASRRADMHLGENSDELQAKAAFELRRLSVRQANDELRSAARAFNLARSVEGDVVAEKLPTLDSDELRELKVPTRAPARDDVEAARAQTRATAAATTLAEEKNKPSLDLTASFALNGRDPVLGDAFSDSYRANRPSAAVGLNFQMPLDFASASAARRGAAHERAAADRTLKHRELDQESAWADLTRRLEEAKERLSLVRTIEKVQDSKLENERKRLKNGRTTTFQVLTFEQDFAQSRLARLRAQSEVLGIVTQMRLFSADPI